MKINNFKKTFVLGLFALVFLFPGEASALSSYWKNYFSIEERKAVQKNAEKYTISQIESKSEKWKGIIRGYNIKNGSISDDDIEEDGITTNKIRGLGDYVNEKISDSSTPQDFSADNLTGTYAALNGSQITNLNPTNITGSGNLNIGNGDLFVDDTSGNVGIGTTSPGAKFEVYTQTSGGLRVYDNASSANIVGGYSGNVVNGGYGDVIAGGGSSGFINSITGVQFGRAISGGYDNSIGANVVSVISGGAHNAISGVATHGTIGGGSLHSITGGDYGTIGGGSANTISVNNGTIAGGLTNAVSGVTSVIAGGTLNTAMGISNFIGGGQSNSTGSLASVVSGGQSNSISNTSSRGDYSAIIGGLSNTIGTTQGGEYSTILGGRSNAVNGQYSVVGGRRAKTIGNGNWAFADGQDADFTVTDVVNTLGMRFAGGYWMTGGNVKIGTANPDTSLGGKLQVINQTTAQTTTNQKIINAVNTNSSFNTTASSLTNYVGYFLNTATRSSGANGLTNIGLYASASGAQNNYAAIFENGNVGVGTTTPVATLDVNGQVKIQKSSAQPFDCDATHDGTIALTSGYRTCVCKGGSTTWVFTTDGTTSCTW